MIFHQQIHHCNEESFSCNYQILPYYLLSMYHIAYRKTYHKKQSVMISKVNLKIKFQGKWDKNSIWVKEYKKILLRKLFVCSLLK